MNTHASYRFYILQTKLVVSDFATDLDLMVSYDHQGAPHTKLTSRVQNLWHPCGWRIMNTPQKTYMEPENEAFEGDSFVELAFSGSVRAFVGSKSIYTITVHSCNYSKHIYIYTNLDRNSFMWKNHKITFFHQKHFVQSTNGIPSRVF